MRAKQSQDVMLHSVINRNHLILLLRLNFLPRQHIEHALVPRIRFLGCYILDNVPPHKPRVLLKRLTQRRQAKLG